MELASLSFTGPLFLISTTKGSSCGQYGCIMDVKILSVEMGQGYVFVLFFFWRLARIYGNSGWYNDLVKYEFMRDLICTSPCLALAKDSRTKFRTRFVETEQARAVVATDIDTSQLIRPADIAGGCKGWG